jgi:glycosyltransferase involved in cell wall biosynthesis
LIYNGIPCPKSSAQDLVKEYRKTPNTKIFIHAGRISKEKNQVALCRVFKSLIEQGEDVALLIAGSIQDRRIYETVEKYLGERIFYLGERDDIPQLMYNSDAMCLPSIWEGLPVTLLEALSVGCIPICSPVGGIPNVVVDGVNGFLSESSNEDDYGKTVRQFLLLTEKDLNLIKENCKQSFSKYDIINTSEKYLKYYKSN